MIEYVNIAVSTLARGGGGGSSGGGGGGGIIMIPILIIAVIVGWYKRKQRIKKAKEDLSVAQQGDQSWSNETIQRTATETFTKFQNDWSKFNYDSMQTYLTKRYFSHMRLVLIAMQQMGRRNAMEDIELKGTTLMGVHDSVNDEEDKFDIEIKAKAKDILVDTTKNEVIYTDDDSFVETWNFDREDGEWKLDGITQPGKGIISVLGRNVDIEKLELENSKNKKVSAEIGLKAMLFARNSGFYYNADFGWLLMPNKGLLFSATNFKTSDINHHVIGVYKDVLVQFFEYVPYNNNSKRSWLKHFKTWRYTGTTTPSYVVAAATLPKSYGNITVRSRRMFGKLKPIGMTRVKTESIDFNKKYDLFTDDMDKVNSLELLHPAYIEKMQSLGFRVDLEIVGNILYLFSTDKKADYDQVLVLLQQAFDEMKM